MKYDVFISYSSLDQKVAEGVCAYLEQHRIRCFIAYRDIPKSVVWASAIVEALDESRMMVVVFSGNFNSSKQVDREIELASEDEKPILTFRISDDAFKGAKKYYLKNLNWIDAFPQPERCFGNLCENVRKLLGMEEAGEPVPGRQPESSLEPTDPEEQCNLGRRYETGDGVPKDAEKAVYWYRKAAEQGDVDAQYNLGVCYKMGKGIVQSLYYATYWFRKAADQGNADAQCFLGLRYRSGGTGIPKDLPKACYWFRKAADQGNSDAQYFLGYCYKSGEGVERNLSLAVYWYRKAAEQGNSAAQYSLGVCYHQGDGVNKDLFQAFYWYCKAAEQGDAGAQCEVGYCYEIGRGVMKDSFQAVYWYRKAAQKGDRSAQINLKRLGETW